MKFTDKQKVLLFVPMLVTIAFMPLLIAVGLIVLVGILEYVHDVGEKKGKVKYASDKYFLVIFAAMCALAAIVSLAYFLLRH